MKKVTLLTIVLFLIICSFVYGTKFSSDSAKSDITLGTSTSKPEMLGSSFTQTDVSKHNTKLDCYLIINNNVYDVSSFINEHPGGSKIITDNCGKEVTGIFAQIHSNRAWDLLAKYKIGTVSK